MRTSSNNVFVYPVVLNKGYFLINLDIPKFCYKHKYSLFIYAKKENVVMKIYDLQQFCNLEYVSVKMFLFENTRPSFLFPDLFISKLFNTLHYEWYNMLYSFLNSNVFRQEIPTKVLIATGYNKHKLFPESDRILHPLTKPISGTKLLFVIDSPDVAEFYLKYMVKAIGREFQVEEEQVSDLGELLNKGVCFLPIAFTKLVEGKGEDHVYIWKPLLDECFKVFNEIGDGLVIVLVGEQAIRNSSKLNGILHTVIPLNCAEDLYQEFHLFSSINRVLEKYSKEKIKWIK